MTPKEQHEVTEQVYAAMETGNHEQARGLLQEFERIEPLVGTGLRVCIIREYGIDL